MQYYFQIKDRERGNTVNHTDWVKGYELTEGRQNGGTINKISIWEPELTVRGTETHFGFLLFGFWCSLLHIYLHSMIHLLYDHRRPFYWPSYGEYSTCTFETGCFILLNTIFHCQACAINTYPLVRRVIMKTRFLRLSSNFVL